VIQHIGPLLVIAYGNFSDKITVTRLLR